MPRPATSRPTSTPGLTAFDALRAEAEPWLAQCYLPPADIDLIAGSHSAVIFGAPGSGKSALFAHLQHHWLGGAALGGPLAFLWKPAELAEGITSSSTAEYEWQLAEKAMAEALVVFLTRAPSRLKQGPAWASDILSSFLQRAWGSKTKDQLEHHAGLLPASSRNYLIRLGKPRSTDTWLLRAPAQELGRRLVEMAKAYGLDGLVGFGEYDGGLVEPPTGLVAFLQTLSYFSIPGLVFKLIMPETFEARLTDEAALSDRRLSVHRLRWQPYELLHITESRVSIAIGQTANWRAICDDPQLPEWLARTGGETPRGYLEQLRPLMAHWLQRTRLGNSGVVSVDDWIRIRSASPPRLVFDVTIGAVVTGSRTIRLSEVELALFSYLFERPGQICSQGELYDKAYYPALYPGSKEEQRPTDFRNVIDTGLWRLREKIEPDPKHPLYLRTHKGKGVELTRGA